MDEQVDCNFAGRKRRSTMHLRNTNFSWMLTDLHSTPPYFTLRGGGALGAMDGRVGLGP